MLLVTQTPKLEFNALACQRGGVKLFSDITLILSPGSCLELRGANGAGKSTLLKTLAGLHSQYLGSFKSSPAVYQGHRLGLDEVMTPLENLAWFAGLESIEFDQARALALATRFDMLSLLQIPCSNLSAGQQRRVAMLRWHLSSRAIWLLDEPLTALDADAQKWLNESIAEQCSNGGIVICATHMPLMVENKKTLDLVPLAEQA